MTHPSITILTLEDCVYLIARSIGATHIKRQGSIRWTAYRPSGIHIMVCSIRFTDVPGELFNRGNWRIGKLPDNARRV